MENKITDVELLDLCETAIYDKYKKIEKVIDGVTVIDCDLKLDVVVAVGSNVDINTINDVCDVYNDVYDLVVCDFLDRGYMVIDLEDGEEEGKYMDLGGIYTLKDKPLSATLQNVLTNTKNEFLIIKE